MITIFRNIYELETPFYVKIETIVDRIRNGQSKELVQAIRNAKDKEARNKAKKKLPSILFSGVFNNRNPGAEPSKHSGFIVIDLDELTDIDQTRGTLLKDPYTHLCFVSPSGNGLKTVLKIPPDIKRHRGYFLAIEQYYLKLGIKVDQSGKNINRVCYESYDPKIFYNESSDIFRDYIEEIKQAVPVAGNITIPASENTTIENIAKWWKNNFDFYAGRNNAIYQLASALNRYGVSHASALSYCENFTDSSKPGDPFTVKEIQSVVNNVYKNLASEHGREVFEDTEKRERIIDQVMASAADEIAQTMSEIPEFSSYTPIELEEMAEEIKVKKKTPKKEGRVFWYFGDSGGMKIDTETLIQFINEMGYWIYYRTESPNDYIFVHIEKQIVTPVDTRMIKMSILDFVSGKKQNQVYNLLNEKQKYFSESFLNTLPEIKLHFLRDTKETAFIPTPDGVFKVTKKGVEKIDYINLTEGFVWRSQITKRNFNYIKYDLSFDFNRFVQLVGGKNEKSLRSDIGYLLHTYNDPANARGVFIYDTNISQFDNEPEGGTGKSLLIEAIKHIREVAGGIPADRIDFKRSFVLQEISESTQVAWIDELPRNFDVSQFFSRITNGVPVEKKQRDVVFMDFADAPKFVFTSNFKPKGSSGSHRRRRIDFGVTDYFNVDHGPQDEFGRNFFDGWDGNDWDSFFSLYMDCLVLYLKEGCIKYSDDEEIYLTVISETGQDFAEYWLQEGNLYNAIESGWFFGRDKYLEFCEQRVIDQTKFNLKKYYQYLKKVFDILKLSYTFEGKGESKIVRIIKKQ